MHITKQNKPVEKGYTLYVVTTYYSGKDNMMEIIKRSDQWLPGVENEERWVS